MSKINEITLRDHGLVAITQQIDGADLSPYQRYLITQTSRSRDAVRYTLQYLARVFFGEHAKAAVCPWHSVTEITVLAFCEQIRAGRIARKAKTSNRYLSVIRGIMREVYNCGQISLESYDKIKSIKGSFGSNVTKGHAITDDETKQLLMSLKDDNSIYGVRDRAIISLYLSCGIRRCELLDLDLKSIDFESKSFLVQGKGGKQRIIPFPPGADVELNKWIEFYRGNEAGPLFCPIHKSNENLLRDSDGVLSRISKRALNYLVTRRIRRAGLKHASPHDFRRTFTTRRGKYENLKTLQDLLGHADVSTTAIYIKNERKVMFESASKDDVLSVLEK